MQPAKFGSWSSRPRCARRSRSAGSNGRTGTGLHRRGEASRSFSWRCSPAPPQPGPSCCRRMRIRDRLSRSHKVGSTQGSSRAGPTRSARLRIRSMRPQPSPLRSRRHIPTPRKRRERRADPEAPVPVDLALRGRGDPAARAGPRHVARGTPALHAIRMAAGAAPAGGRRASRPGHRCLGLDANAAGSAPAAVGRRRLTRHSRGRASDGRRPRRRVHASAGARGRGDDRGVRARAVRGRCRCSRRMDGCRQGGGIGTRAPDAARPGAPRVPRPGVNAGSQR